MEEKKQFGRPSRRKDDIRFEMNWSKSIIDKIDARRGSQTRRDYIEHLLRTHPEMQVAHAS